MLRSEEMRAETGEDYRRMFPATSEAAADYEPHLDESDDLPQIDYTPPIDRSPAIGIGIALSRATWAASMALMQGSLERMKRAFR